MSADDNSTASTDLGTSTTFSHFSPKSYPNLWTIFQRTELSENNRNKSTDPVLAQTDSDGKPRTYEVSFKNPVHTVESVIPKRLINKKELIRGYVLFLLIALVLAAIIFVILAMFFWRDTSKSPDAPVLKKPSYPSNNSFNINSGNSTDSSFGVKSSNSTENTTDSSINSENNAGDSGNSGNSGGNSTKSEINNNSYNQRDAFTRQLTEINAQIENTLNDHFSAAAKILYNPDNFTGTLNPSPNKADKQQLLVDLSELESGWFSLQADNTVIAFKTHYDKLGTDSLELKINHNEDSTKIATRNVFSKTGFPSEVEVTTNQTSLSIEFDWSIDNSQVTLSVRNGDYLIGGILIENTFLSELNGKNYDILGPLEFDSIVENYLRLGRKGTGFGESSEESGDSCDDDLLVHAWQCTQGSAQNEGTPEKCDSALHIDAQIATPQVKSLKFHQIGQRENKCRSRGEKQMCFDDAGYQTEVFLASPSHKISLAPLRQLSDLDEESKCQCEDSLKIIKKSVCPVARHSGYQVSGWAENFCITAFQETVKRSSISAGIFMLTCRSAFFATKSQVLCDKDREMQRNQARTLQKAGNLYQEAISNLASTYEVDVDLNMIFGKRGESVTQVKTKLDFRVTERKSIRQHYIVNKSCIPLNAPPQANITTSQLQYLTAPCQKTDFIDYSDCEYGKYITLIFYVPKSYSFIN